MFPQAIRWLNSTLGPLYTAKGDVEMGDDSNADAGGDKEGGETKEGEEAGGEGSKENNIEGEGNKPADNSTGNTEEKDKKDESNAEDGATPKYVILCLHQ